MKLDRGNFLHIPCPYQDHSIPQPFMIGTHRSAPTKSSHDFIRTFSYDNNNNFDPSPSI